MKHLRNLKKAIRQFHQQRTDSRTRLERQRDQRKNRKNFKLSDSAVADR